MLYSVLQPNRLHTVVSLLVFLTGVTVVNAQAADTTKVWTRWEHELASTSTHDNPCADVVVHVEFTGPSGEKQTGMAFWDGEQRFLIRHVFSHEGEWRWSTVSSDTSNKGLHGQSGVVTVQPSEDRNVLTRRGYIHVSEDGRLLEHADGTPFLWIGDTCWAAPVQATMEEWKAYVADRVAKGYSVLQTALAPDWALDNSRRAISPFLSDLPDITKLNPAYFQTLDEKFAWANDNGLVVFMVGLMETPYRYPPPDQTAVLSRYVAARYSSFEVILSPSFDSGIHEAETVAAAEAIRKAAPDTLVTMHMGTGVGPYFHQANWLSFDVYQSGHNGGNMAKASLRAVGMPEEVFALVPRKPLINGEAMYEGEFGGGYAVRHLGWLSMLSGAVGYTAGIDELYLWEEDATTKMNLPSSAQVSILATTLRAIPWWDLVPAPERILNQPDEPERWMALSLTEDRSLGLAYLPDNASIHLDLKDCPDLTGVLWSNAASGMSVAGSVPATDSSTVELTPPSTGDWVLMLAAAGSPVITELSSKLDQMATKTQTKKARISWGLHDPVSGLVRRSPADGLWERTTYDGVDCIVNKRPQRNNYLYIDVDDRIAFRGGVNRMSVICRVNSDAALENVQLQYDTQGPEKVENVYHGVPPTSREVEDGWTVLTFVADNPYLGNRQNGGADFRVFVGNALCRVAPMDVVIDRM